MSFRTRKNNNNYRARLKGLHYDLHEDDIKFLLAYFEYKCAYCGKDLDTEWHIDHILPLENEDDNVINYGTTAYNCVCVCHICNASKHTKELEQWLKDKFDNWEEVLYRITDYQIKCGINEIVTMN